MNTWQRVVAAAYADGAFGYVADMASWREEIWHVGDSLFAHLMLDLSTDAACTSLAAARKRLQQTVGDAESAMRALRGIC